MLAFEPDEALDLRRGFRDCDFISAGILLLFSSFVVYAVLSKSYLLFFFRKN